MIVRGGSRAGPVRLAMHLQRADTNERVVVEELRGVAARTLTEALREMHALGGGAKSSKTLYHASINVRVTDTMTPERWQKAVDDLERELGLSGQPRVVVRHVKEGREHTHVVWSRIDLERNRAISDSHNYRYHERVSRRLEIEFGHKPTKGVHIGREGQKRLGRTPGLDQLQQAGRIGIDLDRIRADLREAWERTDSGAAFNAAIEEKGYILARGDRRDFVVVDIAGEPHSVPRFLNKVTAAAVRKRFEDLDPAQLPSFDQAKELQRQHAVALEESGQAIPTPPERIAPDQLLDRLLHTRSYVTGQDLARGAETLCGASESEAIERVISQALQRPDLLVLRDRGGETVGYTTAAIRAAEEQVLDTASRLAARLGPSVRHDLVDEIGAARTLDAEQLTALKHALGPEGIAIVTGRAGTGKSHTLAAMNEAAAAAGLRVIGLAPTNTVAQDLAEAGFVESRTAASLLWYLEHAPNNAAARLDNRTLLSIDEAAMLDTRTLAAILAAAERSGAKVILIGDDRQLASIERGGLFTDLRDALGSAELRQVRRQKSGWAKQASRNFAEGRFAEGLRLYDERGQVHFAYDLDTARAELVQAWKLDTAEGRGNRFAFAYTNREVNALNRAIQAVEIEAGRVTDLQEVTTDRSKLRLGIGDRIVLNGTDKAAKLFNGSFGTVEAIETLKDGHAVIKAHTDKGRRFTIDTRSFEAFSLGYAGTIYKGQAKTIDQVYLLHTHHWRDAASYVALTRSRNATELFVAQDQAPDIETLARQMQRHQHRGSTLRFDVHPYRHIQQEIGMPDGSPLTLNDLEQDRWAVIDHTLAPDADADLLWKAAAAARECYTLADEQGRLAASENTAPEARLYDDWHRDRAREKIAEIDTLLAQRGLETPPPVAPRTIADAPLTLDDLRADPPWRVLQAPLPEDADVAFLRQASLAADLCTISCEYENYAALDLPLEDLARRRTLIAEKRLEIDTRLLALPEHERGQGPQVTDFFGHPPTEQLLTIDELDEDRSAVLSYSIPEAAADELLRKAAVAARQCYALADHMLTDLTEAVADPAQGPDEERRRQIAEYAIDRQMAANKIAEIDALLDERGLDKPPILSNEEWQRVRAEEIARAHKELREEQQAAAQSTQQASLDTAGAEYLLNQERRREDYMLRRQSEIQAAQLRHLERQRAALDTWLEEQQRAATQAARQEEERRRQQERGDADRVLEGDIRDAGTRYAQALGRHYTIMNPYESLARAAMAEYAAFRLDREHLDGDIAKAADPTSRLQLQLRQKIEAAEYIAITDDRIAQQSEVICGRRDTVEAVRLRERAADFREEASELRRQYRELVGPSRGSPAQTQSPPAEPAPFRERPRAWMAMDGGYDALSDAHRASAQRSYAAWTKANPEPAVRYDVEEYVAHTQAREAERKRAAEVQPDYSAAKGQREEVGPAAPERPQAPDPQPAYDQAKGQTERVGRTASEQHPAAPPGPTPQQERQPPISDVHAAEMAQLRRTQQDTARREELRQQEIFDTERERATAEIQQGHQKEDREIAATREKEDKARSRRGLIGKAMDAVNKKRVRDRRTAEAQLQRERKQQDRERAEQRKREISQAMRTLSGSQRERAAFARKSRESQFRNERARLTTRQRDVALQDRHQEFEKDRGIERDDDGRGL
jgi:ATP-dependent exoDNAse (exonuclease V) alpha subunit